MVGVDQYIRSGLIMLILTTLFWAVFTIGPDEITNKIEMTWEVSA